MATKRTTAPRTRTSRRAARRVLDEPRRSPTPVTDAGLRAQRRAELEDIITRAIACLDALDWDEDLEPEMLEDDGEEDTAQPVTLAPDWCPAKVILLPRRLRFVEVTA